MIDITDPKTDAGKRKRKAPAYVRCAAAMICCTSRQGTKMKCCSTWCISCVSLLTVTCCEDAAAAAASSPSTWTANGRRTSPTSCKLPVEP
eukprot:6987857-Prymnesium_polylepis.1